MKKIVYIVFLCGFASYSQQQRTLKSAPANVVYLNAIGIKKPISFSFATFKYKSPANDVNFTIYNPTTGLTDNYSLYNDEYKMSNSKSIPTNEWRGSSKVDSFNPTGASDVGGALFVGFFNLLFQKN